jgi:hypothetical protein
VAVVVARLFYVGSVGNQIGFDNLLVSFLGRFNANNGSILNLRPRHVRSGLLLVQYFESRREGRLGSFRDP